MNTSPRKRTTSLRQANHSLVELQHISADHRVIAGPTQTTLLDSIVNVVFTNDSLRCSDTEGVLVFYDNSDLAVDMFSELIRVIKPAHSRRNLDLPNGSFINRNSVSTVKEIEYDDEQVLLIVGLNGRTLYAFNADKCKNFDGLYRAVSKWFSGSGSSINWSLYLEIDTEKTDDVSSEEVTEAKTKAK